MVWETALNRVSAVLRSLFIFIYWPILIFTSSTTEIMSWIYTSAPLPAMDCPVKKKNPIILEQIYEG